MSFNFAKALLDLNECPYFWGKITREEAEYILAEKAIGSFLIREVEGIEEDLGLKNLELFKKDKNGFSVLSLDFLKVDIKFLFLKSYFCCLPSKNLTHL